MKKIRNLLTAVMVVLQLIILQPWAVYVWGAALTEPVIESQAAVLMDGDTGEILYEKNGTEQHYPASITKLLTALVTVENSDLTDTVIFSHDAVYDVESDSGNPIQLEAGDKLTVEECLYAMILESSNQAANALAEHVAGSLEAFAFYMDAKQEELGCKNSTFVNPSGLNDPQQLTTAEDMALIARAVFAEPTLREICSAQEYTLPATLNNPEGYQLHVEHQLLDESSQEYDYEYAFAGKTGYTSAAGNTLVTSAEKDGRALIAVVMKSEQTHYEDTIKLLEYGFAYLEQNEEKISSEGTGMSMQTAEQDDSSPEEEEISSDSRSAIPWPAAVLGGGAVLAGLCGAYVGVQRKRARKRRLQVRRRRAAQNRAGRENRKRRTNESL